jgi:hypothetical protein
MLQSAVEAAGIPEDMKDALAGAWPQAVSAAVRSALKNGTLACGEANAAQGAAKRAADVLQAKQMRKAALQARLDSLLAVRGVGPPFRGWVQLLAE